MESTRSVSIEAAVASALGLTSGLASAWVIYAHHLANDRNYWGLAPTAISILVYAGFAALRLRKSETPLWKLVVAALAGLIALMTVGSILIIMIGCRYDACINL